MQSLYRKNQTRVESAYIITVKDNATSESYSKKCQDSCDKVGMPYKIWDAYDGLGTTHAIVPPEHSKNDSIMNMLKITDHYMTRGEVACALSHISLWIHCAVIDQPIVILEHDAEVLAKFEEHQSYNSICYLGCMEWSHMNWPMYPIPPHASEGPNYLFICRAHAYSIDPAMAKNLLSYVIKQGICAPLDIMLRADLFHITHQGLYVTDSLTSKDETTILHRPKIGRTTTRNDGLEK